MKLHAVGLCRQALTRPYRVTLPMVLLVGLVPLYLLIANRAARSPAYAPSLWLDTALPLVPVWAPIYGALYLFLIVLPVLVVQDEDLIRRTVWAYLFVWLASYAVFLLYPTLAPRPVTVPGDGFAAWGLRFLYDADPPYNCFPSLHVAHSFVSAFACYRIHQRLGVVTLGFATLVALSTLFTKQHYIVDVVAGIALAVVATLVAFRGYPPARTPGAHRQVAPALALGLAAVISAGVGVLWIARS